MKSYRDLNRLPTADLAILAISSKYCMQVVDKLVKEKNAKAFIIISAGFSESVKRSRSLKKRSLN